MIDYEILSLRPQQLFMQVAYRKDGHPDFIRNFNPEQFDEPSLQALIANNVILAQNHWDRISAAPDEVTLEATTGSIRSVVNDPIPDFIWETEVAEPTVIETDSEIRNSWVVRELTEEEIQQRDTDNRSGIKITMRQCRLALLAEGKLADVETAIAELPEPTKTAALVEWEYAATVERNSPFVATLGLAIGYSDAELGNLFNSAILL